MITLTPDEVILIKSILTALRGIKVREIDRALVIPNKNDPGRRRPAETDQTFDQTSSPEQ